MLSLTFLMFEFFGCSIIGGAEDSVPSFARIALFAIVTATCGVLSMALHKRPRKDTDDRPSNP
jgi:hypothetical protein